MKKEHLIKLLTAVFFIVAAADLLGVILNDGYLRAISKPLITVSLTILYCVASRKINYIYLIALFFSFTGDTILLEFWGERFLQAVIAFLITQLLYMYILNKHIKEYRLIPLLKASIPFVLTYITVILIVQKSLGDLFLPIFIYATIITILGGIAFYNYLEKRDTPSMYMAVGVFLFIASDSVLAVEHFMMPHREMELGVIVMFTYILAQYLICRFMIEKSK